MLPSSASNKIANRGMVHSIQPRNMGSRRAIRSKVANMPNIIFRKFCFAVIGSILDFASCSAFSHHIVNVILLRAKFQVRGINTRGIVVARAVMANVQAIWNRAVVKFPRNTVNGQCAYSYLSATYLSMPRTLDSTRPQPTIAWAAFVNFGPKAFSDGASRAMSDSVANVLPFNDASFGISEFGNTRLLSTTAHAQSGRIIELLHREATPVVSSDEFYVMPFHVAIALIICRCNCGGLSTAAHTQAARIGAYCAKSKLGLRELWGMLCHVDSASNAIDLIRERSLDAARYFFACATGVIVAQKAGFYQ